MRVSQHLIESRDLGRYIDILADDASYVRKGRRWRERTGGSLQRKHEITTRRGLRRGRDNCIRSYARVEVDLAQVVGTFPSTEMRR